jgi:predicted GNAT family N-acyltransferase
VSDITYEFVSAGSPLYDAAVQLRYRVFFEPAGYAIGNVFDSDEAASIHLVAREGERVTGYARLTMKDATGHISQMVVAEEYRRGGIGSELMHLIMRRASEQGTTCFFLNARIEACDFYRRFGFRPDGDVFPSPKTGLSHQRMQSSERGAAEPAES